MNSQITELLEEFSSPEEAFPLFLHSHVPRSIRIHLLEKLARTHKVFKCNDNGVSYILDYSIAKELIANPSNATRYTALITDVDSPKADHIEETLQYFPVFSDDDQYQIVRPWAEKVRELTEERINNLDLNKLVRDHLEKVINTDSQEFDLLNELVALNANLALKALNWEDIYTADNLAQASKLIFNVFGGNIGTLLNEADIDGIYQTLCNLGNEKLIQKCLGHSINKQSADQVMSAIFAQWITGFLNPCITWVAYTFLRRFDSYIIDKKGNYDRPKKLTNYKQGCLRDFIPFQAIHRLISRNLSINGVRFREGEFVCIIPDALYFSENDNVVSTVIGAPNRPCMGMQISSKIVDAYEHYFMELSNSSFEWNVDYELHPSLSALVFTKLMLIKNKVVPKM